MTTKRIISNWKKRYIDYMTEMYVHGTYNSVLLREKHCVSSVLNTLLQKTGCVVLVSRGIYRWIGPVPSDELADKLHDQYRQYQREHFAAKKQAIQDLTDNTLPESPQTEPVEKVTKPDWIDVTLLAIEYGVARERIRSFINELKELV